MGCPLFVDDTRECITRFPNIIKFISYDLCESDKYTDCNFYQTINSNYMCKHYDKCINTYLENIPESVKKILPEKNTYKTMRNIKDNYCLSEKNHNNCERYKKIRIGETPSIRIFPDGKSHYLDIIFGREITIE